MEKKLSCKQIQPNYITVKGTLDMILNYQPNSILLLGNGNIAKELALRLKLIDQEFKWTHPNNRTHSKNFYIMKTYFKSEYIDSLDNNFDCIINTIPKDNKINLEKIVNFKTNFIDVTGKSLDYLNNIKCNKIRFDISLHLINEIKSQQNILKNKLSVGRRKFKNIYICSGGYIGNFNDFVVDNYLKPSYLIGIADGKGGFLKRINKKISVFKFNV